jgi:hypothetical protein
MTQKMKPRTQPKPGPLEPMILTERHPVIAALINSLPNPDQVWPEEEQHNWLKMFAMAMQLVYGGKIAEYVADRLADAPEGLEKLNSVIEKHRPNSIVDGPAPPVDTRPAKFHIDQSGFVRNTKTGMAVNLEDVDTDEIFDMRGPESNLDAVTWANGETGTAGFEGVITS